jgi:hypothetical protein
MIPRDRPSDNVVTQQTIAKCGQKMMPLVGGLCLTADFDKMWPKMCPSLEDFVTDISRLERYCTSVLLARLTKVRC